MAVFDSGLELADHFFKRGTQRVVNSIREDIWSGCHKVSHDPERRARPKSVFDEHARFVDLEQLAQRFDALFDQRGEGLRGLVMTVGKGEFHDADRFDIKFGFDKDTYFHL